ncbi:hypothetical protein SSCS72_02818 [Mammaliicoccus sciuri]|uniref:ApeA N-terminal domain 1-containing protein n=1 Tax=Mammaliicoccus sciuri TaxID=1296 RepID=UPI001EF4797D|nr:hypothetical protein [Mammaliicoccus sciuri]CAG7914997.1 hypothetical protein SSCS72_02818 [Mammaliicoccus sciuri]
MTKIKDLKIFDPFNVTGFIRYGETDYQCVFESDGENFKLLITVLDYGKLDTFEDSIDSLLFTTVEGETLILKKGVVSNCKQHTSGISQKEYVFLEFYCSLSHKELPDTFSGFTLNFSNLKYLINDSPFTYAKKDEPDKRYYDVIVDKTSNKEILKSDDLKLSYNTFLWQTEISSFREINFKYYNNLEISYFTKTSLKEIMHEVTKLPYIFSFITNEKHKIYKINLKNDADHYICFISLPHNFKEYHRKINLPFLSDFMKRNFYLIYKYFHENKNDIDILFFNFIKVMYTKKFVINDTADMLRINEGIHRAISKNPDMTLIKRYKNMFESLDPHLQEHLKSTFVYNPEIHNYLKEFRHYHSHYYDKELVSYPDSEINIFNYTVQLHKAYVLNDIGIDSKDIVELLKNTHPQYSIL